MTSAELKDGVLLALGSLNANKFRSGLTILGVLIGVWSVIAMTSLIKGLDDSVQESISALGSNILFVSKYPPDTDYEDLTEEQRHRKPITQREADAIRANCPAVAAVSPEDYYFAPGGNVIKYKSRRASNPYVVGVMPDFIRVHKTPLAMGRFISAVDNQNRLKVCVIGDDIVHSLFPDDDPIGKQIRINNYRFLVIGVFEKKDSMFDESDNNKAFIPLETFMKMYPWEEELWLAVSARSAAEIDEAEEQMITALRLLRKVPYDAENDFAIFGQENIREQVGNITSYIYIAMIVISSVGLMVGGVGVMNIMLVSVTERTREIGVRKAIGARRVNIIWQFLIEAMTLSGTGGLLGIGVGVLTAVVIDLLTPLPFGISLFYVSLGFIVAVSVGLIAGIYPAYRAAAVDPIESLRYE
ncbi:MAG: ABC transporter permease [candidate division Zixibacteria bacterium]|nr:ABC transporter permease [candidate division Zixibacteria bacterium]